jgi:aspartokinase-like uncharacterized kinase
MIEVVVKVGGSLSHGTNLRALCMLLADLGRDRGILVVPGGGPFADAVRDCDSRYGLTEAAAHWMAILAMDQFGYLLCDLIPRSEPARDLDTARQIAHSGRVPVLLPFDLLRRDDALPHSWTVTSDSISARIAELARAPGLVLLKSVDALTDGPCPGAGGGVPPHLVTMERLTRWEGVDHYLGTILNGSALDLWILNGNDPERLKELLEKGSTRGTRLQR